MKITKIIKWLWSLIRKLLGSNLKVTIDLDDDKLEERLENNKKLMKQIQKEMVQLIKDRKNASKKTRDDIDNMYNDFLSKLRLLATENAELCERLKKGLSS